MEDMYEKQTFGQCLAGNVVVNICKCGQVCPQILIVELKMLLKMISSASVSLYSWVLASMPYMIVSLIHALTLWKI